MAEVNYHQVSCRYPGSDKLAVEHLDLSVPDEFAQWRTEITHTDSV